MQGTAAELPAILRLLDDDSPVVREAVRTRLAAVRHELPEMLLALGEPLDEDQQRLIAELLAPVCLEELEVSWLSWRWLSSPQARLEAALGQISAFLSGWQAKPGDVSRRLDQIAAKAARAEAAGSARKLAEFLFGGRRQARFRGNTRDYHAPQNSNLLWVTANGRGNPISLACVFMLVGHRLGLEIGGCNFPLHFLARVEDGDGLWLVDCFNRGRFLLAEDVMRHHPAMNPSLEEVILEAATTEVILARTLRNLEEACEREGDMARRHVVRRLMLKLMSEE